MSVHNSFYEVTVWRERERERKKPSNKPTRRVPVGVHPPIYLDTRSTKLYLPQKSSSNFDHQEIFRNTDRDDIQDIGKHPRKYAREEQAKSTGKQ